MNFRKLFAFLISSMLLLFGNVVYTLCCGPTPDPYDYYVSFFSPFTKGAGYEPFYYTALTTFYSDPTPSEEQANAADWQQYTGSRVSVRDIRDCIYSYSSANINAIASGNLPDSLKDNSFAQYLVKKPEAARYLAFAKKCEPYVSAESSWNSNNTNDAARNKLYTEGIGLYHESRDPKIQERYAFQLIRLLHYNNQFRKAITSFDQFFPKNTNSLLYYKSLSLKAGALYNLKDSVQGAYLFSRVFEKAPSLRGSCYTSYRWCNVTPEMVYPLCRNDEEKATVAALDGFGSTDEIPMIRRVYRLDPASPSLDVLLTRQINQLEEDYLGPVLVKESGDDKANSFTGWMEQPDYAKLKNELTALQQLADSLIAEKKLRNLNYWRISSAYLSYMQRDYAGAKARLAAVETKDVEEKDQWEMINLLININQQKQIDKEFESQLLSSFKWLDKKIGSDSLGRWERPLDQAWFYRKVYRNLLFAVLAPKYHAQGDQVKEALLRGRCDSLNINDFFVSGTTAAEQVGDEMGPKELIRLKDFLQKKDKTPFETYISRFFPEGLEINQTIGTSYLRLQDFKSAASWYKQAPEEFLLHSFQVFNDQLQDFGEDTATRRFNKPISQLDFCNQMVAMEEEMKKGTASAAVYHKYASALFNISYYGRTWNFVKSYRPSYIWYTPEAEKSAFEKQYFGCYKAEEYYNKAVKAAAPGDNEFKARCIFLAARCAQKHVTITKDEAVYLRSWINNRYFPQLTTTYAQTKFYQRVYNQCGYLRDYVKRQKTGVGSTK